MVFDLNVSGGKKTWEYKVVPLEGMDSISMNDNGLQGWELVNVVVNGNWFDHIYKRERRE
jgi:hypothetical protein